MNDSNHLISVKPLSLDESYYEVYAKATYYPTFIRVFKPNSNYEKLLPGLERTEIPSSKSNFENSKLETNIERSLRRTRKAIKDIVICNKFEHLATFTFNPDKVDRQNVLAVKAKMSNWIKNEKKRKGKFEYFFSPEFHKDQVSLHFHALLIGYKGDILETRNPKTHAKLLSLKSFTSGFSNIEIIDQQDTNTKIAYYIQKYITKDTTTLFGKNRYWASRGLKRPVSEDNPEKWYEVITPDRIYENDFGEVLEFDIGKNPVVDWFWEAKQ